MEWLIAAGIAGLLSILELTRTLYIPRRANVRFDLNAWRACFVLLNAGVAVAAYLVLRNRQPFSGWPRAQAAAVIGFLYMAPLTATLATVKLGTKEYKASLQPAYEEVKGFFYARINNIAAPIAATDNDATAQSTTLNELFDRVTGIVIADGLLDDDAKRVELQWAVSVYQDANVDDMQRRRIFAEYLHSRRKVAAYLISQPQLQSPPVNSRPTLPHVPDGEVDKVIQR